MLRSVGVSQVAHNFADVARLIGLDQTRR
jgi:hypothetical protein